MKKFFIMSFMICVLYGFALQSADYYLDDSDSDASSISQSPVPTSPVEVSKYDAQMRMDYDSALYSLDQILDHAHKNPEYYGYASDDEIMQWYQEAKIKNDCSLYSLDDILSYAQGDPAYKGFLTYQQIVDMYYQVNPDKIKQAVQDVKDAGISVFLDTRTGVYGGRSFLQAYRKIPTFEQGRINLNMRHGAISIDGNETMNAKVIVDWMKRNREKFVQTTSKIVGNDIVYLIDLLDA